MGEKQGADPPRTGVASLVAKGGAELVKKGLGGWWEGVGDRAVSRLVVLIETAAVGLLVVSIKDHLGTGLITAAAALIAGGVFYFWERQISKLDARRRIDQLFERLDESHRRADKLREAHDDLQRRLETAEKRSKETAFALVEIVLEAMPDIMRNPKMTEAEKFKIFEKHTMNVLARRESGK